ncbi:MAG TPA: ATP-grasp domain-containing protein [Streptosporangiaceae bacterium]|jgi:biotin carboxylase
MHIAFVDSNTAALEALRRAKEAGHRVTYIQSPAPFFYSLTPENLALIGYADHVEVAATTTEAAPVTAALAAVHAACPVDFAVSLCELSVEPVALACQALGLPGTSPEGLLTARRKDRTRAALRRAGVASAEFCLARDDGEAAAAADAIGYPVVVKPPSGADSRLAFVARDAAEVRAGCQRAEADLHEMSSGWVSQLSRGFLVEERLHGPLVSVELGIDGEHSYPFCISGRSRADEDEVVETGVHIPAGLPDDQARACFGYAEAVCRTIGLDRGVFHLEMIITARGPVLVEANPRVMGGILPAIYQYATGHNIYHAFLQVISGAPVEGVPPVFDGCVAGRRFFAREDATMPASWNTDDWLADTRADRTGDGHARDGHARDGDTCDGLIRLDPPEALGVRPGQPLRRGDLIARVILRGPDYAATTRVIREMIRRTEKALGFELMIGEHDDLA